jgi:predicted transcriptional regulator YheO
MLYESFQPFVGFYPVLRLMSTVRMNRGDAHGRPKSLTGKKTAMAQALYNDKNNTIDEICKTLNISRTTLYRYVKVK